MVQWYGQGENQSIRKENLFLRYISHQYAIWTAMRLNPGRPFESPASNNRRVAGKGWNEMWLLYKDSAADCCEYWS